MKRNLLIVFMLLFSALLVKAAGVDDQGNPNDPAVNDRANACYEGGTWEGKCHTEIEWIGGWYYIRFEAGIFSRADIPEWLWWILPPLPADEAALQTGCIIWGSTRFCYTGGNEFMAYNTFDNSLAAIDYIFPNGTAVCPNPHNGHTWASQSTLASYVPAIQNFIKSKGFAANVVVCTYSA